MLTTISHAVVCVAVVCYAQQKPSIQSSLTYICLPCNALSDSFGENGECVILHKSYKNALRSNRYNIRTVNFLFLTIQITPFLCIYYFDVLQ